MAQFTTAQVAEKFDTDTRTLRKFLRADAKGREVATPGKGARYMIEGKELQGLKKRFSAWGTAQAEAKAAKDEVKPEVVDEDTLHPADIDDEGHPDDEPTDTELAELDDLELDEIDD